MSASLTPAAFRKEILFCVLILAVGIGCLVQAYTYDDNSSHFPRFLSIALVFLGVANIFRVRGLRGQVARQGSETPLLLDPWLLRTVKVVVAVGAYVLCLKMIGYYVSTVLFLLLSMLYFSRGLKTGNRPWLTITLSIVVFLALVYGLFNVFLSTSMPKGLLL